MIPLIELQKLSLAMPKCGIQAPNDAGCSWIVDRSGERVGDINWQIPRVTIYEDYEYADEMMEALEGQKKKTPKPANNEHGR